MCFGGPQPTAGAAPAPAPAPAQAGPIEASPTLGRQQENIQNSGNPNGPSTRVDRSVSTPGSGSGLNM